MNKTARAWPVQQGKQRMGAVSAFGMSGTNAHLIMQEYPQPVSSPEPKRSHYLLCLSAKTEEALYRKVDDLILHLQNRKPAVRTGSDRLYIAAGAESFSIPSGRGG